MNAITRMLIAAFCVMDGLTFAVASLDWSLDADAPSRGCFWSPTFMDTYTEAIRQNAPAVSIITGALLAVVMTAAAILAYQERAAARSAS